MKKNRIISVALGDLVPHALQSLFDACSAAEDERLRNSIIKEGLDQRVEVFVPVKRNGRLLYAIRDGNRRVAALRSQGRTHVSVRVRHDLPGPDTPEGKLAFLRANAERRQLGTLQRVRIAVAQHEIEHAKGGRLSQAQLQAAREAIGALIDMSGRNVARYLRVCRAPAVVQRTVSRQRLRLTIAEKVADAHAGVQQAIARAIETAKADADVNGLVEKLLSPQGKANGRQHTTAANALAAFARSLERGMADLSGRTQEASLRRIERHAGVLRQARRLLRELLDRLKSEPG